MLNIQNINVPFISAFDIFPYNDNVGLTITPTGAYYFLPFAYESFSGAPTGFNLFVSGLGFWQGSGYAFNPILYIYEDNFAYSTGFFNNLNPLNSGHEINGYSVIFPLAYNGTFNIIQDYQYEPFNYSTGFTTGYLNNGLQKSGYNNFVVNYSGSYNIIQNYQYENFTNYNTGTTFLNTLNSGNSIKNYNTIFPNNYSGKYNYTYLINDSGSPNINGQWYYNGTIFNNTGYFGIFTGFTGTTTAYYIPNQNYSGVTGDFTLQVNCNIPSGIVYIIPRPLVDNDTVNGFGLYLQELFTGAGGDIMVPTFWVLGSGYTNQTHGIDTNYKHNNFYTCVRSGQNVLIYIGNQLYLQQTTPNYNSINSKSTLSLGNQYIGTNGVLVSGGGFTALNGSIGFMALWNYARSPSQIAADQTSITVPQIGLVNYINF